MKHLGFASIAALKQYIRYADAQNINTHPLLRALGLHENVLLSGEGRITGEQFQSFLSGLIALTNDPLMGLASALYVETHSYSLLGTIAEQSDNLEHAIERIPMFERLVGDMGTTEIERTSRYTSLAWHCNYDQPKVVPHMIDNVLASWTLYARWLTLSKAQPLGVYLARQTPSAELQKTYRRVFSCPVYFEQKHNSIRIAHEHLSLPIHTKHQPNTPLPLEGKARLELSQLRIEDETFKERVSRSIRAHLQLGIASKELIAQEHVLSERHLQRQLSAENCSYRELLDSARKERAMNFLRNTELSTTEIAHNLGYQDERCLFRSVKRWTKRTPHAIRAELKL